MLILQKLQLKRVLTDLCSLWSSHSVNNSTKFVVNIVINTLTEIVITINDSDSDKNSGSDGNSVFDKKNKTRNIATANSVNFYKNVQAINNKHRCDTFE